MDSVPHPFNYLAPPQDDVYHFKRVTKL